MSTPLKYYREGKYDKPITFAVKHKDFETRMASRSGGIFTALSDVILNEGGVVYGCVLTEDFTAIHIRAETEEERNLMRGSKYIQSQIRNVFSEVKNDLLSGRKVLFSGTSCQVAGLNGFLGKSYENLFCVDIVCHGVPSPSVWKEYLKWQENKNSSSVISVDFRNKKDFGWKAHMETLFFENGKQVNSRVFTNLFYSHNILRPCCYQCPYKCIIHPGNITIADYWGIDTAAPGFNDNKGVSLCLINDDIGNVMFGKTRDELEIRETKIEDSLQTPLQKPYPRPKARNKFWIDFQNKSFDFISKKYGEQGIIGMTKHAIKKIIHKFILR